MTGLRRVLTTFAPPLIYLALIFLGTRPPRAVYKYANPTVMTVTDRGGPTVLHSPPVVYPPQALRAGVEGSVTLQVAIAADGTVAQAVPVSGPEPLRQAAVDNVRQWLFEGTPQQTRIDVGFSLRDATRSLALPEVVRRLTPAYKGRVRRSRFSPRGRHGGSPRPRRVRPTRDRARESRALRRRIRQAVDLPPDAARRQAGAWYRSNRRAGRFVGGRPHIPQI